MLFSKKCSKVCNVYKKQRSTIQYNIECFNISRIYEECEHKNYMFYKYLEKQHQKKLTTLYIYIYIVKCFWILIFIKGILL